ncbi:MAG: sigma-54-dependent Fis family transcriptional regulator, partial [Bdellovibrio sp.]|nr:sigma-54-dependent Fis family transcriptional regulator [Bdellovibrio sp.]
MNRSKEMNRLFQIAARSEANVLILGATGTGKTTLAREIHDHSTRKERPFVAINLATLHEGTLESELFGHERGSFTSADSKRVGRLELANSGTVFLDEVGDLSLRLQARLLDFLHSRRICPVGGNRDTYLNVRVIAATHRDLSFLVRKREFREDLLHRLRVITMETQSLKDRGDDFGRIVHACLEDVCAITKRSVHSLSAAVAEALERYSWPGNFRELRNVLEFAVLAAEGSVIHLEHLPTWFLCSPLAPESTNSNLSNP